MLHDIWFDCNGIHVYQEDEWNHIFWKSVSNNDDGKNNADNNYYGHKVDVNDYSSQIADKRTHK